MRRVYEVSGAGLTAIIVACFVFGYAVGYSVWNWTLALRGLL